MKDFLFQKITKDSFKDSRVKRSIMLTIAIVCILSLVFQLIGCVGLSAYAAERQFYFTDVIVVQDGVKSSFREQALSEGDNVYFIQYETRNDGSFIVTYEDMYLYYITSEDEIYYYMYNNEVAELIPVGYFADLTFKGEVIHIDQATEEGYYALMTTMCDGSTCNVADENNDNICDDCGAPFVWSLRNDTYDFNGHHFATTFELGDGSTTTLDELWAGIKDSGGNVFILNDTWENALFYIVSPAANMQVVGNSYQTKDRVVVTLYSSETTADGTPYWKYTATDVRNNAGANLGTLDQIIWTAENLNDQYGFVVVDGDINFMTPLWEKVEQVTQGTLPNLTTTLGGNLMTLTLCGVGLITLLVGLYLLLKVLRTYLKT